MHVAELCITDLRSATAVVKVAAAIGLKSVVIPSSEIYDRISAALGNECSGGTPCLLFKGVKIICGCPDAGCQQFLKEYQNALDE